MKIKKGDTVRVISGKYKDANPGKVLFVDRKNNKIIVEGVNIVTKHKKPNREQQQGGIIKTEAPIHVSNVMYVHNGQNTRIGYQVSTVINKEGKEVRVKKRIAKSTGEEIDTKNFLVFFKI